MVDYAVQGKLRAIGKEKKDLMAYKLSGGCSCVMCQINRHLRRSVIFSQLADIATICRARKLIAVYSVVKTTDTRFKARHNNGTKVINTTNRTTSGALIPGRD